MAFGFDDALASARLASGALNLGTGAAGGGDPLKLGLQGVSLLGQGIKSFGSGLGSLSQYAGLAGTPLSLYNLATGIQRGDPYSSTMAAANLGLTGIGAANAGLFGSNLASLAAPLAGAASWAAAPLAVAGAVIGSGMEHQANRLKNLGHEAGSFGKTYAGLMPRLYAGAQDYDDPLRAYQYGMEGLAGVPSASSAAGHSGTKVNVPGPLGSKSFQFPDYSDTIALEQALIPMNLSNVVRARDALSRQGASFEAAPTQHVDLGAGGAYDEPQYTGPNDPRQYGNLSAADLFKQLLPYTGVNQDQVLYQKHSRDAEGNDITLSDWYVRANN